MASCISKKILFILVLAIFLSFMKVEASVYHPKILYYTKQIDKENILSHINNLQTVQSLFGKSR